MKINVCVPSYRRPKVKTLEYLPFVKIYVDGKDFESYKQENPDANIVACADGVQGNLSRVRNYILDTEFAEGADAVCFVDDDLLNMARFVAVEETHFGYKSEIITAEQFPIFLEKYTMLCEEFGYKMWGVNCNKDSMNYYHGTPFSTLAIVNGPFSVHLPNPIRYDERLPLKEDYDISIQHLNKYRGILRINSIHYDCLQSENVGGCANMRNLKKEQEQFELLQKKWGKRIVHYDTRSRTNKQKIFDYNPVVRVPIAGI